MRRYFNSIALSALPTLTELSGALLLFACDDFTCADYATCDIPDSGSRTKAAEAGTSLGVQSTTHAGLSSTSTDSRASETHRSSASFGLGVDASVSTSEGDAGQPSTAFERDANVETEQKDASQSGSDTRETRSDATGSAPSNSDSGLFTGGDAQASAECNGEGQCVDADTDPPQVVSITPNNNATNVDRNPVIELTFSEPIRMQGLGGLVTLQGPFGDVPVTVAPLDHVTLAVSPNAPLPLIAEHQLELSAAITDLAGNTLAQPFQASFTTRDGIWDAEPTLLETENGASARLNTLDSPLELTNGDILAVWAMTGTGTGNGVWSGRFNKSTGQWSRALQFGDSYLLPWLVRSGPDVIALAAHYEGDELLAWRYTSDAYEWSAPQGIEAPGSMSYVSVGTNQAGVHWAVGEVRIGEEWALYAWRYNGQGWTTTVIVPPQLERISASVALDPSGNAICLFTIGGELRFAKRAVSSNSWNVEDPLDPGFLSEVPSIHSDATGAFYAIWTRTIVDNKTEPPVARVLTAFNEVWGGRTQLQSGEGQSWSLQVRGDGLGNAIATWYFSDEDGYHIQSATYSLETSSWTGLDTHVGAPGATPRFPVLVFDPRGNGILTWSAPDVDAVRHYARRFTRSAGWGDVQEYHALPDTAFGVFAAYSSVILGQDGAGVVLWPQSDGTRENLWALHFR